MSDKRPQQPANPEFSLPKKLEFTSNEIPENARYCGKGLEP
jgi:hypothetical protein